MASKKKIIAGVVAGIGLLGIGSCIAGPDEPVAAPAPVVTVAPVAPAPKPEPKPAPAPKKESKPKKSAYEREVERQLLVLDMAWGNMKKKDRNTVCLGFSYDPDYAVREIVKGSEYNVYPIVVETYLEVACGTEV